MTWSTATAPQYPTVLPEAAAAASPWPDALRAPSGVKAAGDADPALLDQCHEGRWQQDAQGLIVWACPALHCLLGTRPGALLGRRLADSLGAAAHADLDQALGQALAHSATQGLAALRVPRRLSTGDGWLSLTLQLWQDAAGRITGGRGVARDISAQVALEQRLQRSDRSLLELVETASEGIAVVQDQVFRFINRHLQTFLGIPAEALLGRPFLEVIHPDDRPTLIENHQRRLAGLPVPPRYEFRLNTEERGVRWLELSGSVLDWEGRPATLTHIADITARKALDEQVRQMAFQDTLTGLANRRLLEERLEQALDNGRHDHHHGALLYLDLDLFKQLNDTRGHEAGDQVLVSVARRLRQTVRASDVVARLGGDEFVVLLTALAQGRDQATADALQVAEKLRQVLDAPHALSQPAASSPLPYRCPASIGLTVFGPEDDDRHAVLRRADEAMYVVKAQQRGRQERR